MSFERTENQVELSISDNGIGIPTEILSQLGTYGLSYGKPGPQERNGLGIYHAINTIKAFNGKIDIKSHFGRGTVVKMNFPTISSPAWFLDRMNLNSISEIICIDDDLSMHQVWRQRSNDTSSSLRKITVTSFTSPMDFLKYVSAISNSDREVKLFLMDFEFLNHNLDGLDLIEQLHLQERTIFVTSRYEELEIRARAEKLKVKILPKSLATSSPLLNWNQ